MAILALLKPPLRADALIARARRSTGLADFGDTPFQEGLEVLLRACAEEAQLSLFGHFGTRWDLVRFLSNLLRLRYEEIRAPEILDRPIERPIFIAGLPRSGTTFLHQLLAQDPANRVPRVWQMIHPYPTDRRGRRADRRRQRVARQLRMFQMLAPEFRSLHPIDADSPQECSEITAHVFASTRFDTTYFIPDYRRWLDRTGHLEAYRFHKRFLQHLQHQTGGGRWVLKCPDHIFALEAIRAVYPDARLVLVHRDPLRVLPSVARLTEVLRKPFTRSIDRIELGRQESERWLMAADLMIDAAEREPFAEPIFHLRHRDLVSDPPGAAERLYRHFRIALDPAAAAAIGSMAGANPNGGYGNNHYRFEDYRLDPAVERQRYARYMERFGIVSELEAAHRLPARAPAPAAGPRPEPAD
jgi:hypothetical protein